MVFWVIVSVIIAIVAIIRVKDQEVQVTRLEQKVEGLQQQMNDMVNWLVQLPPIPQADLSPTTEVADNVLTESALTKEKLDKIANDLSLPPVEPFSAELPLGELTSVESVLPASFNADLRQPNFPQAFSQKPESHQALSHQSPDEGSPNVVTSLIASVKNWFFGENLIVRVGALVLLVGVVLLLKLASQYLHISLANRLLGIAVAGLITLGIGYKTAHNPKKQRRNYGLTLQGVGFAMIYLTVFTSFRLYQLLPANVAFPMLAVVAGLTVLLSVRQNALPLAVLAFGGAFFAPILVSNPNGSVVLLFGYYLLLNIAVAVIAHFRTWKLLNALSLFVTFGLAYVWGFGQYVASARGLDSQFSQTRWQLLVILLAHIGLYLFIAIRYSQQVIAINVASLNGSGLADTSLFSKTNFTAPSQNMKHTLRPLLTVDAGLLLGTAILGFGLLSGLLHDLPLLLALASGALSAVYLGLGFWLLNYTQKRSPTTDVLANFYNSYQLLIETVLALGVAFLVLVIPLAFSAHWVSVGWAIQGASLVWLGQRTARQWTVWFGLALQAVTAWIVLDFYTAQAMWYAILDMAHIAHAPRITAFSATLPLTVLTLALGFSAFILRQGMLEKTFNFTLLKSQKFRYISSPPVTPPFRAVLPSDFFYAQNNAVKPSLIAYVLVIATGGFYLDSVHHWVQQFSRDDLINTLAIAVALSVLLLGGQWLHARRGWRAVRQVSRGVLPLAMGLWAGVWFAWSPIQTLYADDGFTRLGLQGFAKGMLGLMGVLMLAKVLGGWLISRWHKEGVKTHIDQLVWLLTLVVMASSVMLSINFANGEISSLMLILPSVLAGLGLIGLRYLPNAIRETLHPWLFWLNVQKLLQDSRFFLIPAMGLWLIGANFMQNGRLLGVYIPLLNPLDIMLVAILGYLFYQSFVIPLASRNKVQILFAIAVFWTVSSMLVRSFASLWGTPIWNDGAWQAGEVQTGLTILWSIVAMGLMFFASKKAVRLVWYAGMGLLGLVVIKLVMVDMSHTSAILRVVSFIGAGVLMLVIGYLAPLPPVALTKQQD